MDKLGNDARPYSGKNLNGPPGVDSLVFILSGLAAIIMFIRAFYLAPRGFDLTDESFYLMWMADPFAYNLEVRLFGFFYHPLYVLMNGDITYLRLANLGLTWLLFYGLAVAFIKKIELESVAFWPEGGIHRDLAALLLTAQIQLLLISVSATPSYNILCGQGLAVSLWGLLLIGHQRRACAFSGWVMLGFGGAMTFMGKPSSAVLLAIAAALYILAAHRDKSPWALLSVVVALAALAVYVFTARGSFERSVDEYRWALQLFSEGTYSFKKLLLRFFDRPHAGRRGWLIFFAAAGFSYAYVARCAAGRKGLFGELFLLALPVTAIGWVSGLLPVSHWLFVHTWFTLGPLSLAAPLGALLALRRPREWASPFPGFRPNLLKLALLLLVLPQISAFGSSNYYIGMGSLVSVFWLMGAVALMAALNPDRDKIIAAFKVMAAVSIFFICGLMRYNEEYPYRQSQALSRQSRVITALATGREFIVPDDMHDYLAGLQKIAAEAGFEKGQCLMDMTGHSPGAVYFLGAKSPGQPWFTGAGYENEASRNWIVSHFDRLPPDDLKGCWMLLEPEGLGPNDPAWLAGYGLDVEAMSEVGAIMAPYHFGQWEQRFDRQVLLKPE
jgi:hypothetical protein